MLEFTYYNTEKIDDLKDFFTVIFVLIDDAYKEIIPSKIRNRRNVSFDRTKRNLYLAIKEIQRYFLDYPYL